MNYLESPTKSTLTMLYSRPSESPSQTVQKENFIGEWWNPLPESIINRIQGKSYNEKCPVPLTDLAYIRVKHWNFKEEISTGELIVHKNLAQEITEIFQELFEEHFLINQMVLIDEYDANDELTSEANNTSAFCVHDVTGKPGTLSKHSYGVAIDINPFINPYIKDDILIPKGSEKYLDRTLKTAGIITKETSCYRAFIKRGYSWGGEVTFLKDYHHFQKDPHTVIQQQK